MKFTKWKRAAGSLLALLMCLQVSGQVNQVIVANGGVFSPTNYATVGTYYPTSGTYTVFDSVPASSVQDVVLDGGHAYVAADSFLIKYDIDTYQRLKIADVKGIRKIAVYDTLVLVTRGYGVSSDYVQAYGSSNLDLLWSVSGLSGECEGIVVYDDTAFVAVPIGFAAGSGKIGVIDLNAQSLKREIDLDSLGRQVGRVYREGYNLYFLSSIGWGSPWGVVNQYNVTTGTLTHHVVGTPVGMGAGLFAGELYADFGTGLGVFSTAGGAVTDTTLVSGYFAAGQVVGQAGRLFLTETDYFSYGSLMMYDFNGTLLDSIAVGISCEALAADVRPTIAVDPGETEWQISAWPNPVSESLNLHGLEDGDRIELWDLTGRSLGQRVSGGAALTWEFGTLPAGMYLLRISRGNAVTVKRIRKQ